MQNLSKEIQSLLESKETQYFLKVARGFIELIEVKHIKEKEFYLEIHKKLSELYNAGLSLNSVELIHSNENTEFKIATEKRLEGKNVNLISSLGKDCFYWEVFDPTYEKENESTQGWLVDDIGDIYADLKEEVYKIDQIGTDEAIEDGLWQLKFGFTSHWGNHCVNALRALHYIYYEGKTTT
ncbi:DUF5063 domain-containing protein [Winogradskyella sp. UBA3174]|uniref:DUF5063 domain-containing protein n=1 Tax=Winogradskyella sp. UBA3174 TaxID=1947785 RepID=UPI0025FDB2AD|nr:DUF5063 domain-containing protein [Winogradskyella sp. UBA3174]|tara:strand:- start:5 stop:550 length:546 start_codon:yes stop_codon:yes gene_type:complete